MSNKPVRVVQLSDCHLFAEEDGRLLGMNTQDSFELVLDLIKQEQSEIDLVLATGDLAQDGSMQAYQRMDAALAELKAPSFWLEGNHDVTAPMLEVLKGKDKLSPCTTEIGGWRLIMLDSTIAGEVPGELYQDDLEFLKQELEKSKDYHVMICLHHHPIPMGCDWLDTQVVANAEDFFSIVDAYSNIKAIIWGHVHQEFHGKHNDVELFSIPSTCVQFKPESADFAIDDLPPGYRSYDLYPDGRIESSVSRVEPIDFEIDYSVKGY